MNLIEDKQIQLAEKLSNYNEILHFVKTKIPEEDLDRYLNFFEPISKKVNTIPSSNNANIISMWGDEIY